MQIHCPHCGHTFESTGQEFHFCPDCGRRVKENPSTSSAAGASSPGPDGSPYNAAAPAREEPTPWERRKELGLLQGYWQTWTKVVLSPAKFWASVSPQGPLQDALFFSWITSAISSLMSLPFLFLQDPEGIRRGLQMLPLSAEAQRMAMIVLSGNGRTVLVLTGLVLYPLGFIINTAIIHLFALLFGASKNGFTATARAAAYSAAPMLLGWLPCVGVAAGLYVVVLYIWGLGALQRTSTGRAGAAVLSPIGVVLCCTCVGVFAAVAAAVGSR